MCPPKNYVMNVTLSGINSTLYLVCAFLFPEPGQGGVFISTNIYSVAVKLIWCVKHPTIFIFGQSRVNLDVISYQNDVIHSETFTVLDPPSWILESFIEMSQNSLHWLTKKTSKMQRCRKLWRIGIKKQNKIVLSEFLPYKNTRWKHDCIET